MHRGGAAEQAPGRDGAQVWMEFDFGPSIDVLRLEVKEKMEQVRPLLPDDESVDELPFM